MAERKLAECSGKPGLKILVAKHRKSYEISDVQVELVGVWGVVTNDSSKDFLLENVVGTKEAVTRLAQEVFGSNPKSPSWQVIPATQDMDSLLDAERILKEFNIPQEPLYED